MILKASQRGGGVQLGRHLLKAENEHIEIHEIRGFMAETVLGAMKEAQAVAMGTRCKQFLFSVSLNPPESETVSVSAFEAALDRIEEKTGLNGHPRIVVFHEKEGRRHCHAVWSRIDVDTMTATPLPFFKTKLREVSKQLYLEHGWKMPRGLVDSQARDPRNFSLAEWQQAKRTGQDPARLKALIQECWAASDSKTAFAQALEERGLYLAKGDRRAHVALTDEGEVLSIARMVGKKAKEVAARLGPADDLRSVDETRAHIAKVIAPRLEGLIGGADKARTKALTPLEERRREMTAQHRREREQMAEGQQARAASEAQARRERFRSGVKGLWDRLTGEHSRIQRENEADVLTCVRRDRAQRDALIAYQMKDRRLLQEEIRAVRQRHAVQLLGLHRDLARLSESRERPGRGVVESFGRAAGSARSEPARQTTRRVHNERGADRGGRSGPGLGD